MTENSMHQARATLSAQSSVRKMTLTGVCVALLAASAYISFPLPFTPGLVTALTLALGLIAEELLPDGALRRKLWAWHVGLGMLALLPLLLRAQWSALALLAGRRPAPLSAPGPLRWLEHGVHAGLLAVMLVTEADRRLRSEAIPEAFRGLPITLVYIGVLALAIYGFTGHSVIL